jgi:hypothetical protein
VSTWFWLCRANCQWGQSSQFDKAIRANGVYGRLSDFNALSRPITLDDDDVFCIEGLSKADLDSDLQTGGRPGGFSITPAGGGQQLYLWGHHSGPWDLVYLVVVTDHSALHLNPRARPQSWKQKAGPLAQATYSSFKAALKHW